VDAVMGFHKPEAIRTLVDGANASHLKGKVDAIHDDFVARMCRFYESDPSVGEMPGARRLFESLHARGIKIALNTGFSRKIAQIIIDRFGWAEQGLVDASVASDEVARGRPHPDMIHHLMKQLHVDDPRHVAKVGDTPVDLQEGQNVGCGIVIGYTSGTHSREELSRYPSSALIGSLDELPAALGLGTTVDSDLS
ncbi:HAD family hydrolase, partial [Singulisphaera rosea]